MRIGYDAKRLYNNFTGLGNYSRNLLLNLGEFHPENEYLLYTQKVKSSTETAALIEHEGMQTKFPSGFKPLWRTYGIGSQLKADSIDLYHGLSNEIPVALKGIKKIVTIHDLIFKIYPETYKTADRLIYDQKFGYACRNADHVVAISETTKQDIIRFYSIPEERISVIYQSCHPLYYRQQSKDQLAEVSSRLELPSRFMLYVGSVNERKNLLQIAKALEILRERTDVPLIVVGSGGDYKRKVEDFLLSKNLQGRVLWYSSLSSNTDLQAIYQLATLFLYPSLYEGFGIPIAEALLSGTPVITSNCSCLPEAAGPHAELVDPTSATDLAAAIYRLFNDPELCAKRSSDGLKYALEKYDRKGLTDQMNDLYKRIL